MADIETARQIALSLPNVEEYVHVGRPAFKVKGKRTFATLWPADNRMTLILSRIDQSVFHSFDPSIFYPIPNKWGLKAPPMLSFQKYDWTCYKTPSLQPGKPPD